MTHTLAMEWAQYNIRVNSVSPGLVNTAMTYWVPQQPDWEQQLKYYGGMPRLAEVEELGGAYVYLLSDAASYTTSIDIPVNGVIGSKFLLFVGSQTWANTMLQSASPIHIVPISKMKHISRGRQLLAETFFQNSLHAHCNPSLRAFSSLKICCS